MVGTTVSHHPALGDSAHRRDSRKRNNILEKLGGARHVGRAALVKDLAGESISHYRIIEAVGLTFDIG
jgi:hypothetical protein